MDSQANVRTESIISQDTLGRLEEVRRTQAELKREERELQAQILARLDAGAMIEPGPLGLSVVYRTPRPTLSEILKVLGREETDELMVLLETEVRRSVRLEGETPWRCRWLRDS